MKSQLYFSLFMTMKFGKHSSCIQDSFLNDNLAFFHPARGAHAPGGGGVWGGSTKFPVML